MKRTRVDFPDNFLYYAGFANRKKRPATWRWVWGSPRLKAEIRQWIDQHGIKCYVYVSRRCIYFEDPAQAIQFKLVMGQWEHNKPEFLEFKIEKVTIQAKSRSIGAQWGMEIVDHYDVTKKNAP